MRSAEAEGKTLLVEGDVLLDGGVVALAVDDVEVCEVVLGEGVRWGMDRKNEERCQGVWERIGRS